MLDLSAELETEASKEYLGVYPNLPEQEYRRALAVNKSGMDDFQQSPAHYRVKRDHPPPPTPAMLVGSAFHYLVLEPEKFKEAVEADPYAGSMSQEAKAYRATAAEEGRIVISTKGGNSIWSPSDWDMIHYMRDAVMEHPIASLLIQGETEQSLFWKDKETGLLCKARIDVFNRDHEVIVDLKSAADASYSGFQKAVHRYHYFIQDAFYSDGWDACGMPSKAFIFIVVEKQPPFGVGCYTLEPEWQRVGRVRYQHLMNRFHECVKKRYWPCYPTEVRDLIMPGYAKFHDIS